MTSEIHLIDIVAQRHKYEDVHCSINCISKRLERIECLSVLDWLINYDMFIHSNIIEPLMRKIVNQLKINPELTQVTELAKTLKQLLFVHMFKILSGSMDF